MSSTDDGVVSFLCGLPEQSQPVYDLSLTALGGALALSELAEAMAVVAVGVEGFAAVAAAGAVVVGVLGVTAILTIGSLGIMALFLSPELGSELRDAGEGLSWISSPTGLSMAISAGLHGASAREMVEAGEIGAAAESLSNWRRSGSKGIKSLGETVNAGSDLASFVARKLRSGRESEFQRREQAPSARIAKEKLDVNRPSTAIEKEARSQADFDLRMYEREMDSTREPHDRGYYVGPRIERWGPDLRLGKDGHWFDANSEVGGVQSGEEKNDAGDGSQRR